jgi:hypothetical protein
MDTKKVLTEEQKQKKDARKALKKEKRVKYTTAMEALNTAIAKSNNPDLIKLLAAVQASKATVRSASSGETNFSKFVKFVVSKKEVSEDEVFKMFKIGRKDAHGYLRKFLKNCEAKDRVWINFTPSNGMYKVVGTGEVPSKEYVGFVPANETVQVGGLK